MKEIHFYDTIYLICAMLTKKLAYALYRRTSKLSHTMLTAEGVPSEGLVSF